MVILPDEPFSGPIGTGFFVSHSGLVVTANHVVEAGERFKQEHAGERAHVQLGLAYGGADVDLRGHFRSEPFDAIGRDERHDLALLRARDNPFEATEDDRKPVAPATLSPERPRDGEAIATSGYPLVKPVLVTTAGIVASSWDAAMWAGSTEVDDVFLGDLQLADGHSGGPVYRVDDGAVIGVAVATELEELREEDNAGNIIDTGLRVSADIAVITPARYIFELAEALGEVL